MIKRLHIHLKYNIFSGRWKSSERVFDVDPAALVNREAQQILHETAQDATPLPSASTTRPVKSPLPQVSSSELPVEKASLWKRRWTSSMRTKEEAMRGPRFEYANLAMQPMPRPAIDLVHEEPVFKTDKRVIYCDGGEGALGHPKVYINLDKPEIAICGYCGKQFIKTNEEHGISS
jgi:NADH dehydrogenase (ubiquinone) Fe-S protein 6